ncbi:flagellar hook protein [Massilia sp. Root133]|uniref:flagellar hook-associated protein FlgL n=1 Tax=unclassified Massilia TaxID=2609279 RepID=UPI0006F31F9C|nr:MULTISPECIES: flagellar hook-associated protein FlgL [unclassified Massilia]KQX96726.1 flagellar hook protein [Massilia sp. Root133]KQZ52437.1 flagellar hook protein [Massilia sp. Root1485]
MTLRISTNAIYQAGTTQINTLQSQMAKTQMQLSTNKRMLTAADDPIGSAKALELTQSQSMNTQFGTNRTNAKSSLSLVDKTLTDVSNQIQDIQTLIVTAGNGGYTQSDREALAIELEGRMADLLGSANTTDGTGTYLFSGYKTTTQPFTQTPAGATYQGDQGQRMLQVGSARKMAISESGSAIFEANVTGNGTFVTQAAGTNTGAGIISPGAVTDATKLTGHDYAIAFQVAGTPAVTTYTVTDNSTSPASAVLSNQPYTAGAAIAFDGMSFDIKGAPANGDQFSVQPSQKQSVFTSITNLIQTLRSPSDGSDGKAALANNLNAASLNMKNALDNVLTVQASVGARLKEVDSLDSTGDDLNIQYQTTLSDLQDLDMVKAVSLYTQQQQTLQAAQVSFKTMSGLSLFNYIS